MSTGEPIDCVNCPRTSLPQSFVDNSKIVALESRVKELEAELKRLRVFYTIRMDTLEKLQVKMPEPFRTQVCNILANGKEQQ